MGRKSQDESPDYEIMNNQLASGSRQLAKSAGCHLQKPTDFVKSVNNRAVKGKLY